MVIGDARCGKTDMLRSLLKLPLPVTYSPTFLQVSKKVEELDVQLTLIKYWESYPHGNTCSMLPYLYANVDAVLICYAVDEKQTLHNVFEKWEPQVR